jgi:2-amino-4-hydroxy-6-hydroxymethyldihydropteridine diphosphokinase
MARVFLGVGSNIEREREIAAGLDALAELFGEPALSPVYDSAAIGFEGEPFLNLVAAVETALPLQALAHTLRQLEFDHGRALDATRFSARRLDIDILTYADRVGRFGSVTLPRGEILENAFVLRPLAELAPGERHPVNGRTYAALWDAFDQASQPLVRVDFDWRGRRISTA